MVDFIKDDDAVASYALFARASDVFGRKRNLPELISLISLLEAAVLYERIWYLPFGDTSASSVIRTEIWSEFAGAGLCDVAELREKSDLVDRARDEFQESMRTLGSVSTYREVGESESLDRAFYYGMHVNAPVIYDINTRFWNLDEKMLTGEGVRNGKKGTGK